MKLENGYKVIYEKAVDGTRTFYASKTGLCDPDIDNVVATFVDADYRGKMVYEHAGKFYVTTGAVPAFDENGIPTDECLTAFDKVFVAGADTDSATETDEAVENTEEEPVEDPVVDPTGEPEDTTEPADEEEELGDNEVTEE